MESRPARLGNLFLTLALLLAACQETPVVTPGATASPSSPTATIAQPEAAPSKAPVEEPVYLAIIWHQHQPVYYKDPQTGIYARPWVRVHAAKDYVDMAAVLESYPDIHVTFNLTPSLIQQLDDIQAGAKDLYWTAAEVPAGQLTQDQKRFLIDRFFDTHPTVIDRFPRYKELSNLKSTSEDPLAVFKTQDYLDLQVLFNLAWTDPDWLAQEPLASLVSKGSNYAESDKQVIFEEHRRLVGEVIPIHKKLQDAGQIEITTTPFAHPILPLLVTTDLARQALPDLELPGKSFVYGQDAVAQVRLGMELYENHFGRPPRGMWPAEGSVAQEIVSMVARSGIQWMATDEGILANSLGMPEFARDAREVALEPDKLYRPYTVEGRQGGPLAIIFRDRVISDKVGFTYGGMPGRQAAADFIERIHNIRAALQAGGAKGPHLVSVILDGENAWETYPNDGKEFLHSLYQGLSSDPTIKTVTPSEFLALNPNRPEIEKLWAGSWHNHDFSVWIGESEENKAWELLATTREFLQEYENGRRTPPNAGALEQARLSMYAAEGSDWFWFYGSDRNSAEDNAFDQQFRELLKQVYTLLGQTPPVALDVPVIPLRAMEAERLLSGLSSPDVDGALEKDSVEWQAGGLYLASAGVMAASQPFFEYLLYGFDSQNLYVGVKTAQDYPSPPGSSRVELYFSVPGSGPANSLSRGGAILGFPANRLVEVELQDGELKGANITTASGEEEWSPDASPIEQAARGQDGIEIAIPFSILGPVETGDLLSLRLVYTQALQPGDASTLVDADRIPYDGTATALVPDLGTTTILLDIADPENDDHGPGAYSYPTDAVFPSGVFDLLNFQAGYDEENVIFKFSLRGPVKNPWNSPNGLSVQTFDIYIDKDRDGQGGVGMLPGRNLALQEGYAWDFAITAEGWEPGIFVPGQEGPEKIASASEFSVLVDPGQQKVTVRVPKSILGDNPEAWRYAALVLGQEGYPAGGVMRVRDVNPLPEQWRFGGASGQSTNHPRVVDFAWPVAGEQEAWLSEYIPTQEAQTSLKPENFAKVQMLEVEK